jgi:hypothetical protein
MRVTSFLPRTRSKAVFVLLMSCYCITVTELIVTWRRAAHVQNPPPSFYWSVTEPLGYVVAVLVIAPLFESLQLAGVFELARYAHAPQTAQVLAAALVVSLAHVWPWWPHAVIVLPSFCIQAAAYLYWRRISWKLAYWLVVCIHVLNNLIPAISFIGHATRKA